MEQVPSGIAKKLPFTPLLLTALLLAGGPVFGQGKRPSDWPSGTSPESVGKRVAENYMARPVTAGPVQYQEVCTWYGSLIFAQRNGDTNLSTRLIKKFQPLFTVQAGRIPTREHVDDQVFGALPLEVYLQNHDTNALALGLGFADGEWRKTNADGVSTEARYWVDDLWMMTLLQVQAWRATQDPKYIDRMATTMVSYLDRLQQTNGLFFHATNAPFFWSRGNGWAAAGMAEMLRALPENHPERKRILQGYRAMMAALVPLQGADGLWKQLLDQPDAWSETSGSAMITFAMVTGVKNGWLDAATYNPIARKAWLGLAGSLDERNNLKDVCTGTGTGTSAEYYLGRRRVTGDLHGQAAMLWAATAWLR